MCKTLYRILITAAIVLFLSGCVQIDYIGRRFPATPDSIEIKYYKSRAEMPKDVYTIIGRMILTSPENSDTYVFEKHLRAKARELGGDAVCIVSTQAVNRGTYATYDEEFGAPSTPGMAKARHFSAEGPVEINSFGTRSELNSGLIFRTEFLVKALLLKDRKTVDKYLENSGR